MERSADNIDKRITGRPETFYNIPAFISHANSIQHLPVENHRMH